MDTFLERSEEIAELAAALSAAQGEIRDAEKDGDNPHLGNRYATLSSIRAAIREPFAKNGLSTLQIPVPCEPGNVAIKTVVMHSSGQYVSGILPVPISDMKGLTLTQMKGSALKYARRYGMLAMTGVCDEEDDGSPAATSNRQERYQDRAQPPRSAPQQAGTAPAGAQEGESAQPAAKRAEKPSDAKLHEDAVNHARQEYFKAAEEVGIDKAFVRDMKTIRSIVNVVIPKYADILTSAFGVTHWNQLTVALLVHAADETKPALPGQTAAKNATG